MKCSVTKVLCASSELGISYLEYVFTEIIGRRELVDYFRQKRCSVEQV